MTPDEQHAYGVVGIPSQPDTDWALLVVDDLTEQERRELAEREFVSNAAHELRTPLTTIIGAVEVLQAGAKEDPAERDRFLAPHRARVGPAGAARARDADAGARALRAGAAARSRPSSSRRCCARSPPACSRTPASRSTSRSPDGLAVETNRDLLEQALRNLGENAAKHTARGSVVLRAYRERRARSRSRSRTRARGSAPRCSATSSTASTAASATPHGFGLGLAIVRESVRTLGGRIELDSSPGEGTVFRILLAPARVREEVPAA